MLRPVKSTVLKPRIIAFRVNNSTTVDEGDNEAYVSSHYGPGGCSIVFREQFAAAPIVIATSTTLGHIAIKSSVTKTGFNLSNLLNGSYVDGTVNVVVFGQDSTDSALYRTSMPIKIGMPFPRMLCVSVDTSGAITQGSTDCSINKDSTGVYTITFKRPFGRTPICVANSLTSAVSASITSSSKSSITVTLVNTSEAAVDGGIQLLVIGTDSIFMGSGTSKYLQSTQPRMMIAPFSSTKSGSTYAPTMGSGHFTPVSGGTGVTTLVKKVETFGIYPPVRDVVTVANGAQSGKGTVSVVAKSANGVGLGCINYTGSAVDETIDVLVIGSGFPNEV